MNDLEKRNKLIHFIEKWFIIGLILFIIIQIGCGVIIHMNTPKEYKNSIEEYDKDYIGHWYSGTFFINMTVKDNFDSYEQYEKMNKEYHSDFVSKTCYIVGGISLLTGTILLVIAALRERKKKLLEGNIPNIIFISGLLILVYKIFEEIDLFIETTYWSKYSKGFLTTVSYYPQIHLFIIPILLILLGLLFKQKQLKDKKLSTRINEKIIKSIYISILVVGLSFILYRFGVRVYELINNNTNIRLPFYYYIFDLPRSFAMSSNSYTKLIILRLMKDLPIFISSFISIIMFVKIIMASIKNKIISKENNKRFKIIFISLLISSIIFNVVGYFEVRLLNNEFLYQYKDAVYTIAIRSLTEPLLYGFFIYLFKHYIELGYNK